VQLAGHDFLKNRGVALVPATAPDFFTEDTPIAVLVRQVLGAIAQFEKASIARISTTPKTPRRTRPSPIQWRVGVHDFTFEACSGFTRVTARRIAQPPKAAFVTRLQPGQLPNQAACQLPELPTSLRVDSSSTGVTRRRGAHWIHGTSAVSQRRNDPPYAAKPAARGRGRRLRLGALAGRGESPSWRPRRGCSGPTAGSWSVPQPDRVVPGVDLCPSRRVASAPVSLRSRPDARPSTCPGLDSTSPCLTYPGWRRVANR
jgi:hypothetical protein